jgi:hypothetical protein
MRCSSASEALPTGFVNNRYATPCAENTAAPIDMIATCVKMMWIRMIAGSSML